METTKYFSLRKEYFYFQLQNQSAGVQVWPSHTFINHEFQILFISSDTKLCHKLYQSPLPSQNALQWTYNYTKKVIEIHFPSTGLLVLFSRSVSPSLFGSWCIENQAAIVSWKLAPISQSGHLCPRTLTNSGQREEI